MKTKRLSIRATEETKLKLEQLAALEGCSMSKMVEWMIDSLHDHQAALIEETKTSNHIH